MVKVLGIETSCDETAVSIVDDEKNILAHQLNSQAKIHQEYGGVVPEIAARGHVEVLDQLILDALKESRLEFKDIDAFAATAGPGLIGGVIVGLMAAKTLSSIYKKPFIAVNHLEAHALTVRLTDEIDFPYLLLLISGGHCQIINAKNLGDYQKIGQTIDDALGEAYDKVAKMLGLNYPGGPEVEKLAKSGDENSYKLPRPLIDSKKHGHLYNFSFSGLKTAVRREIEKITLDEKEKANICASFQKTVCKIIINRLENVVANHDLKVKNLVIAGGVAANRYIFEKLTNWAEKHSLKIVTPPISLCTDNAAMIAWTGVEKLKANKIDNLDFKPKARWELS